MTIGVVSSEPVTIPNSVQAQWVVVANGSVPLRCWWAPEALIGSQKSPDRCTKRAVIVLPEVFGVNAWVRSVAERIAQHGMPALAVPLFARSAPGLELGYSDEELMQGRRHKDLTTIDQIQSDVDAAIKWMQQKHQALEIIVVGFCFGGHAALLAAINPNVTSTLNFYGAGVSRVHPVSGRSSLDLVRHVPGRLICIYGTADPLIPPGERSKVRAALVACDPGGQRLRDVELVGADHGFMCETRQSYNAEAAAFGWELLVKELRA